MFANTKSLARSAAATFFRGSSATFSRSSVAPVSRTFASRNATSVVPKVVCKPSLLARGLNIRTYSVLSQSAAKPYSYKDIKELVTTPKKDSLLIDVREPAEFQEGHIPGALNVPFKSSPGAFDLSEEEFEDSFGFQKPDKDSELVFYCLGGVRSTAAEELANSFGYTRRGNYQGSYEDWLMHENGAKKV